MVSMVRTILAIASVLPVLFGAACGSSPPTTGGAATTADASTGDVSTGDAGTADASTGDVGSASDTWTNYAVFFFQKYCVSCHNAQDPTGRDYTMKAVVAKDMAVMRCGVAAVQDPSWNCAPSPTARQFPIGSGPKPSDSERARIVAWIDAGEP
jgi:hypothetical protein